MPELQIKKLLQVVSALQGAKLTGTLTIINSPHQAFLYFNQGQLVEAQISPPNLATSEDVLYLVLNWQEGQLQWQASPTTPEAVFDAEQRTEFYQAAEDLARLGYFEKPLSEPEPEIISFISKVELSSNDRVGLVKASSATNSDLIEPTVAVGLPHPPILPGQPFVLPKSTEQVGELITQLRQAVFTGYAILSNTAHGLVLLACEEGVPTAVYMSQGAAKTYADSAWNLFKQWDKVSSFTLATLEPKLLVAWRALLGTHRPYQDLPATSANFHGLIATFKRGSYSGVIHLYQASVCYYNFIYQGQPLGTYTLKASDNRLYPAGNDWSGLLENPQARLEVMVSRSDIFETSSIFEPGEISILAGTLSATIGLIGKLSPLTNSVTQLAQVITELNTKYPFLQKIIELDLDGDTQTRANRLRGWLDTLQNLTRPQVWAAFEELLEKYMQPTCLKVGSPVFQELFLRALGPALIENLAKMNLQLKFCDGRPALSRPSNAALSRWEEADTTIEPENPYDF